ncbi:hypothetical protein TNCV_3654531 [Trichonephila clavipes]|nr:hypothetical protein TNCV_3654531 [Trichonephila clavipes]
MNRLQRAYNRFQTPELVCDPSMKILKAIQLERQRCSLRFLQVYELHAKIHKRNLHDLLMGQKSVSEWYSVRLNRVESRLEEKIQQYSLFFVNASKNPKRHDLTKDAITTPQEAISEAVRIRKNYRSDRCEGLLGPHFENENK